MQNLGNILKDERIKHNMTQEEIAKLLNVNRVTYTGWESGKHQPKLEDLVNIANIFKTSVDYLLGRYMQ